MISVQILLYYKWYLHLFVGVNLSIQLTDDLPAHRFVDGLSEHNKVALLKMGVEPSEIEHFNNLVQFIKTNC